jgi:hypothetical protein
MYLECLEDGIIFSTLCLVELLFYDLLVDRPCALRRFWDGSRHGRFCELLLALFSMFFVFMAHFAAEASINW